MVSVNENRGWWKVARAGFSAAGLGLAGILTLSGVAVQAQSGGSQVPASQEPAQSNTAQEIPDAPSAVQPPQPVEDRPPAMLPDSDPKPTSTSHPAKTANPFEDAPEPPRSMPAVRTVPAGSVPGQSNAGKEQLFKLTTNVNFVQVPVMVKDSDGRRVDGLLNKDFSVYENGKKQEMSFFTSDPFELSVALVLDIGMPDSAVQKINQTFPALVGAFSPYDEVGFYTYSSTVSQVSDYTGASQRLTAVLNQMKTVRGHNNGPPVLGGPFGPQGPTVNGVPVGGGPAPVSTPARESHVLNDAILRAALDLSKRDKTRRKVIFVISDGRELGSKASYSDVLKLLLAQGIQVKAIAVEAAALPIYSKLERLHIPDQGYSNLLPKYSSATGGGQIYTELSRNAIEDAYAQITSEARNQYTLGYTTRATASTTKREIEVRVGRPGLKIYAKDGYYPVPSAR
jgi:VWFA-related protein